MKNYKTEEIKNIAVLGHGASGKTTLCDAILYTTGKTDKIGSLEESSLTLDFDAEEKKRGCSISSASFATEYKNIKINLLDTPGQFDYTLGVSEGLIAADSVIIALSGKSGLNVGSELCIEKAKKYNKPISFFIGKLNSPRAHFYMVMSQLTGKYGSAVCPIIVPFVENDQVVCYVNLIENKAYKFDGINYSETNMPTSSDIENLRTVLIEAAASAEEELMEKYFEGETLSADEIKGALKKGFKNGEIYPVFAGVNQTGAGVPLLLNEVVDIFPSYEEKAQNENALVIFKTVADPFVGKLSCFKVLEGKVKADMKFKNQTSGEEVKLNKIMYILGAKQEEATEIVAGDIGCTSKLGDVKTGDILYTSNAPEIVKVEFQRPNLSQAVYAVKKGDEEKINAGLLRLMEEDPTITYITDKETKEQILSGLGEQHLDVIKSKLKTKFGVDIELRSPKVAYRETIRKKVKVQGKHKKQSGGHGQFGDVWIEFEPTEEEFVFEEKIFGGSVPKNFFPAVEKGLRDSIVKGVLAGYPMVGVKATLVDGSYHPVDSSEMAFKTAAGIAFRAGIPDAMPVLLEPIGKVEVLVPDDYMGDVIGDITKRRGRVLGMDAVDGRIKKIEAEVPMAETADFATAMRSITQGWATFKIEFERYEETPAMIAKPIIDAYKE